MSYPNDSNSISSTKSRVWPTVELFVQYGLSDRFELGMTTNFIGLIGDVKYQYFDGEVLDMAVDLGFGTSPGASTYDVDNETGDSLYNTFYPAAIFTLNFSEKFRTSLSHEHKKSYNTNPAEDEKSTASFNGGSINVSAGKDYLFMAQTSYFSGKDFQGRDVLLRSIGFGFGNESSSSNNNFE